MYSTVHVFLSHDLGITLSLGLTVNLLFFRNATDATTAHSQVLHVSLGKR